MEVYTLHEKQEDSDIRSMKKSLAFALLMLMFCALYCVAEAEEMSVATQTDLSCLHVNTKEIIFFFDSPAYTSVSATSHKVYGPATVQVVCLDCGEVLSEETVDYAEELRPHSMKKGQCALCGYREKNQMSQEERKDDPGERTLFAQEDSEIEGLLFLTLSREDLAALNNSNVTTALIRGNSGNVAIALEVKKVLTQTWEAEADLYLELAEREDGSFFAAVNLVSRSGEEIDPDGEGINLRFYREAYADVRVSLAPVSNGTIVETKGVWDEHGYWSVQYQEEGTYFILQ